MGRLNILLTGHAIADEIINRVDSTSLPLGHDTIRGTTDLEIWTGVGKTGTKLTLTTDYTVGTEDTRLTTAAGVTIYTKLAIVNGAYQNTDLYVTYKTLGDYASVESVAAVACPIGALIDWGGIDLPDDDTATWAWADGSSLLRASYPVLYKRYCKDLGTFTVSIASPGLFSKTAHGLVTGDRVELTTSGALPTGLVAYTNYYVIYVSADTFRLATTVANARAGTAINTSGSQSGTHSIRKIPYGTADSTHFYLPDRTEASPFGSGTRSAGVVAHESLAIGEFADDRMQGHWHAGYLASGAFGNSPTPGIPSAWSGGSNIYRNDGTGMAGVDSNGGMIREAKTDGANGTPRTGRTTRGKIVGATWIVRIA